MRADAAHSKEKLPEAVFGSNPKETKHVTCFNFKAKP